MGGMEIILQQLSEFTQYLELEKNASLHTVNSYRADIDYFIAFARLQGAVGEAIFSEVDTMLIRAYFLSLKNAGYALSTISRRMAALKAFYRFLLKRHDVINYPFTKVYITKTKTVPVVLSVAEITELMDLPAKDVLGVRDKAILELLYAAGFLIGELVHLTVKDVDIHTGYILIYGKKANERIVPIGRQAVEAVSNYLNRSRPVLCGTCQQHDYLFVNAKGSPLSDRSVRRMINKYNKLMATSKHVTPKTLRVTMGVHLLTNGADILSVQEMLGKPVVRLADVNLSGEKIKAVYQGAHPRA